MHAGTKTETRYHKQRLTGIGLGLLGFALTLAAFAVEAILDNDAPSIFVVVVFVGYGIAAFGFGLYAYAFVAGMKYTMSEEYKQDLRTRNPWE